MFKIGDTIRPRGRHFLLPGLTAGQDYRVSATARDGAQVFLNELSDWFPADHFFLARAKVTQSPEFDVGDKVTPIDTLGAGQGVVLTPGVAYKVRSWERRGDGSGYTLKLEGCSDRFPGSLFRKYEAPKVDDLTPGRANKFKGVHSHQVDAYAYANAPARANHVEISFTIDDGKVNAYVVPNKESPMSIIPPLEIPAAPQPEPLPPESASVQVLRKLVEARRTDLKIAIAKKLSREKELAEVEDRVNQLRSKIAADCTKIDVIHAAIAEALADIEKLGGRPEEVGS